MRIERDSGRVHGFTRAELSIVLSVLSGLAVLVPFRHPPSMVFGTQRIRCINNLKNVGLASQLFANDHDDHFPMRILSSEGGSMEHAEYSKSVWRHFAVMSNQLSSPKTVLCPEDKVGRKWATSWSMSVTGAWEIAFNQNANISFFVGTGADRTKPKMLLAGDRNIISHSPVVFRYGLSRVGNLGTNHSTTIGADWDRNVHIRRGNLAFADGSVGHLTTPDMLRQALRDSGDPNNRIAVPD